MTWRELLEVLSSFDDEYLDLDAQVWLGDHDLYLEDYYKVTCLAPLPSDIGDPPSLEIDA